MCQLNYLNGELKIYKACQKWKGSKIWFDILFGNWQSTEYYSLYSIDGSVSNIGAVYSKLYVARFFKNAKQTNFFRLALKRSWNSFLYEFVTKIFVGVSWKKFERNCIRKLSQHTSVLRHTVWKPLIEEFIQ